MGSFDMLIDAGSAPESFAALTGSGVVSAQAPVSAAASMVASGYGANVSSGEVTFAAIVETPSARDVAMLAEGAGIDAANADVRRVIAPCGEFESVGYPCEGGVVGLIEAGAVTEFTVLSRSVKQIAGVDVELRLLVYRTPQAAAATVAQVGESGAGMPKLYAPAVNPY